MQYNSREIRVFVSYAFNPKSGAYTLAAFRSSIKKMLDKAKRKITSEISDVNLSIVLEMAEFDKTLPAQISRQLNSCHFGIIDISDHNPNVFFEFGQLTARGIPHVVMKSKKSLSEYPIPSDITDKFLFMYDEIAEIETSLTDDVTRILKDLLRERNPDSGFLTNLWFPASTRLVHVVCPTESEKTSFADAMSPNYSFIDNLGDRDALLDLMIFLSRNYSRADIPIYEASKFPVAHVESNLVIIGGPGEPEGEGNVICDQMMRRINASVRYRDDCEALIYKGEEFVAEYDKKGYLIRDYGYFARCPNPLNSTTSIVLINGIHTYGVTGSALAFSEHPLAQPNISKLVEFAKTSRMEHLAFECFFSVDIVAGRVVCPEIDPSKILPLALSVN